MIILCKINKEPDNNNIFVLFRLVKHRFSPHPPKTEHYSRVECAVRPQPETPCFTSYRSAPIFSAGRWCTEIKAVDVPKTALLKLYIFDRPGVAGAVL